MSDETAAPPPPTRSDGPDPAPSAVVFHGVSFDLEGRTTRIFGRDDLEAELRDPAVFSWIDLQAPDIGVLNALLRRWEIDLVLSSHFEEKEILPRIVEHRDCLAFYLYEVVDPEQHLDTARTLEEIQFGRMILIMGGDFVITFHRSPLAAVDNVKSSCADAFRLVGKTPGFITFLFLERCVYDYAHLNLANDNFLDVIEEGLLAGGREEVAADIAVSGRNILTLKKLAASLHIVLMLMATKRSRFISDEARASFQEMLQNAAAVRAAIDSSRDLLDGILGSLHAAAANRTSEIARVLTVLSGILLPLNIITGIYGMNFENMPELKWRYGYFITLGEIGLVAVGLYLLFRRLGWVGGRPAMRP